jgi:propionate CoA-transferase
MKLISKDEAAELVGDGHFVGCAGFVGAGHAEAVTAALERRFLKSGHPRDLTLIFSAGQGDRVSRGVNHFGNVGMTRRIVGGHWRSATRLAALALAQEAEALNLPQGVLTHLFRAIAAGKPGLMTRIGLHTFVDPRHDGARLNGVRFDLPKPNVKNDWVRRIEFEGEEQLFYPSFPLNVVLLRGTASDARGNISTEEEAFHHELLALAQAARNSGGVVVVQVKRLVECHASLAAVRVPGILVDYVVVSDDDAEHSMTFGEQFNPSYLAAGNGVIDRVADNGRLDARTLVQRRAVLELARQKPRVVNLGVGMPAAVGGLAHGEGVGGFTLTVEAGPIGGVPADGLSFGASAYPEAVIDQPAQFDFYEGGGIDLAILGLAEFDQEGNVNVSKFGEGEHTIIAGVGGFINITQSAKSLVFMGTFTAGGLDVEAAHGRLRILHEGRSRKLVEKVSHLSFNGPYVESMGRPILYITERAVFELRQGRITLTEIAPGIDLQKQVLDLAAGDIDVAEDLVEMDARIFTDGPMQAAACLTDIDATKMAK